MVEVYLAELVADFTFGVHFEVVGIMLMGKDFTLTFNFEEGAFCIDVLGAYYEG
jgi:hypothetical protein